MSMEGIVRSYHVRKLADEYFESWDVYWQASLLDIKYLDRTIYNTLSMWQSNSYGCKDSVSFIRSGLVLFDRLQHHVNTNFGLDYYTIIPISDVNRDITFDSSQY
jgi:hypothetical protein